MMKKFKVFLFWFIHCTWDILMTLIGAVGALVMIITKHRPKRFGYSICFIKGHNWGGVCLGPFIFLDEECDEINSKTHEAGHSLFQALPLGPLFPFVVGLPSMLRYYLFDYSSHKQRSVFSSVVGSITIIVGAGITLLGVLFNILALIIIGVFIVGYAVCILLWLFCHEIKKMDDPHYGYYDIWFEKYASKCGMENYQKNKNILKYE